MLVVNYCKRKSIIKKRSLTNEEIADEKLLKISTSSIKNVIERE